MLQVQEYPFDRIVRHGNDSTRVEELSKQAYNVIDKQGGRTLTVTQRQRINRAVAIAVYLDEPDPLEEGVRAVKGYVDV